MPKHFFFTISFGLLPAFMTLLLMLCKAFNDQDDTSILDVILTIPESQTDAFCIEFDELYASPELPLYLKHLGADA